MPDEQPIKTVLVETTTVSKRQEGESASLSFAASKHVTKWIIVAVVGLFGNLTHSLLEDFLPARGEAQRQQVKEANGIAVGRNNDDNQEIIAQLKELTSIKSDFDAMKISVSEMKTDIRELRNEIMYQHKP